jgi:hypothetical protein
MLRTNSVTANPFFDSPFERRRLRILNNLFLVLTKAGHQPWLGEQARNIGVTVGSQKISFTLDHPRARTQANGRMQTPHEAYEILRLEISATGDSWTDDHSGRIEDRLREIVLKLIVAGEVQYRANVHTAYENACRRRAEMEHRLAEQRAEAARLAREKALKAEAEQRKTLLRMAADHRAAQDIRTFVNRSGQGDGKSRHRLGGLGLGSRRPNRSGGPPSDHRGWNVHRETGGRPRKRVGEPKEVRCQKTTGCRLSSISFSTCAEPLLAPHPGSACGHHARERDHARRRRPQFSLAQMG